MRWCLFAFLFSIFAIPLSAQSFDRLWLQVDSLEQAGLYRSALQLSEEIVETASRSENYPQLIKGVVFQAKFLVELEEDGVLVALRSLRRAESATTGTTRAILQSYLGEWYRHYFDTYYWRLQDRSEREEVDTSEVSGWSADRLLKEANRLYLSSVATPAQLQDSLEKWAPIIREGRAAGSLAVNLYDLLVLRAIDHFADSRSWLAEPTTDFRIARAEAFAPPETFAAFTFPKPTQPAQVYQALRLYQRWIGRLLMDSTRRAGLVQADLHRLDFVREHAWLPDADQLYRQALDRILQDTSGVPTVSEAGYRLARLIKATGDRFNPRLDTSTRWAYREAHGFCDSIIRRFRRTYGAAQCRNLQAEIERRELGVQAERVYLPNDPILLSINYRNVRRVWVRMLRFDPLMRDQFESLPYWERGAWLSQRAADWEMVYSLEGTEDYREHRTEVALPPRPFGYYAFLVSDNRSFSSERGALTWVTGSVSEIAYLELQSRDAEPSMVVLNRRSGEPMAGVTLEVFDTEGGRDRRDKVGAFVSDANGLVSANVQLRTPYRFRLRKGNDLLEPDSRFYRYGRYPEAPGSREVVFFTDRAIYRPGQTLYFKGLVLHRDQKGVPRIQPGQSTTVQLLDANLQEVATLEVKANEYGTFHGSFSLPTLGMLGSMQLRASVGGQRSIQVEEYRRPRFEVQLDTLDKAYALGEEVSISGQAAGFAGDAISGADCRYRITRRVYFPWWRSRYWFPDQRPEQQIAFGTTRTDPDGSFRFSFPAMPDYDLKTAAQPAYTFRIEVEVVDITGETHSATETIRLSEKSIVPNLRLEGKVATGTNLPLLVEARDLNGNPAAASAQVEIYALKGPGRTFLKRYWEVPDQPLIDSALFRERFPHFPLAYENLPENWPDTARIDRLEYRVRGAQTVLLPTSSLPVGNYRVVARIAGETEDTTQLVDHFYVFDREEGTYPPEAPDNLLLDAPNPVRPGSELQVGLYSGKPRQPVWLEIGQAKAVRQNGWHRSGEEAFSYFVEPDDRGDLHLQAHWVRQNRHFQQLSRLSVPWAEKQLTITYETFRDKLKPGQEEEWRLRISGPEGKGLQAEVLAAMYDASLDQFVVQEWPGEFYPFFGLGHRWSGKLFGADRGEMMAENWNLRPVDTRRQLPGLNWYGALEGGRMKAYAYSAERSMPLAAAAEPDLSEGAPPESVPPPAPPEKEKERTDPGVTPAVRKDLQETVFFLPQVETDAEGALVLKFTMGESLTRWKFLTFAHTPDFQLAYGTREVVTRKDLMILPNAPRFLREGDRVWLTAKVVNNSAGRQRGEATLQLEDPVTASAADSLFGHNGQPRTFDLAPGASAVVQWALQVPAGKMDAVLYRFAASSEAFADGEQNVVPVVGNRMLVTETLPVSLRSGENRDIDWEAFDKSLASPTADPLRLSLEVTSNPAWLAVKALPYLMDFPYECTEQVFNRFFANSLAAHLADRNPAIERVYERWRAEGQVGSPLQRNEELKNLLLTETPWVRDAASESRQQERIALLFDRDHMAAEQARTLALLQDRQAADGGFPWFPGGPTSWYITQYLLEGMGRLSALKVLDTGGDPEQNDLVDNMIRFTDQRALQQYRALERQVKEGKTEWEEDHLGALLIHWVYARSFFIDHPMSGEMRKVRNFYLDQLGKYWTGKSLQLQAMGGVAAHRWGRLQISEQIMASLQERAIRKPELGIYWKADPGWYWHQQSLETQALMINFFIETNQPDYWIDGLRAWLVANKRVNRWETTKATAAAIFALLERNDLTPADSELVSVSFPDLKKKVYKDRLQAAEQKAEAGTGYYKVSWSAGEINPDYGRIKVKNPNAQPAWTSLYFQYFEELDRVEAAADGPLQVEKGIYLEKIEAEGRRLEPWQAGTPLKVGDKLVVRLEITSDRDMEFVHLQDRRAAGLEPIFSKSGYEYQSGLGYYKSIRDAAHHFFFDWLPRGQHVLEYPLRVVHPGDFSSGAAEVQCMYAPEFSGHSSGTRIRIE